MGIHSPYKVKCIQRYMKNEEYAKEKQEKRLNKDKIRWLNWKAIYYKKGIPEVSQANSNLIIQYLKDMEVGSNVSSKVARGPRSERRLNDIREKMTFFAKKFESLYGVKDLTKVRQEQIEALFYGMLKGEFKTKRGTQFKSVETFSRIFKAFWHWHQKVNKKKGIILPDLTEDVGTKQEKPDWVYLTEDEVRKVADSLKFEYRVLVIFLYDTGIRAPVELLNLKVSDLSKDFKELQIRVCKKKSFSRKIKLMICSELLKEYISLKKLNPDDYLFPICPEVVNRNLQRVAKELFGDKVTLAGEKYSKLTMYDLRHNSACYWLPRYSTESALKYRFGWRKTDKIFYYSELLGMRDTIREEDLVLDVTKTELQNRVTKLENDNQVLSNKLKQFEEYIKVIDVISRRMEEKIIV